MNRNELKVVLADQEHERARISVGGRIIEREQLALWREFRDDSLVRVIMGVRRSGKTVLSHQLLTGRSYGSVNFDDERLAFLGVEQLNDLVECLTEMHGKIDVLMLDEVQNIEGWELFVNRLQRSGVRVYVTGSNANLLGRELSTHLTGRFLQMELLPFSFREFLTWKGKEERMGGREERGGGGSGDDGATAEGTGNESMERDNGWGQNGAETTEGRGILKKLLSEYLEIGGFPDVVKNPEIRSTYLSDLYSAIVSKDIIARHNIRYVRTFRELAANLISNYSNLITYNKLKNIHGLKSVHTVKNYVDMLAEAYVISILEKYSPKAQEVANSPKKVYVIDTGLASTLALSSSPNHGRIMENAVFLDLARRRSLDSLIELYYWRDHQGREIDFVVKRGIHIVELIQVSCVSSIHELEGRELRSLILGSDITGCSNLTLITWDLEGKEEVKGRSVDLIPLWKWLLISPIEHLRRNRQI